MPKYLMGVPVDRWSAFLSRRLRLPTRLTRLIMSRLIRLGVGDQARFGVPRPAHPMAQWLAGLLSGGLRLPPREAMRTEIEAHQRTLARTHVGSPRYTLEVDYEEYAGQLRRALRAGKHA